MGRFDVQLNSLHEFEMNSKMGNSLKDNQLTINRMIEQITGLKQFDLSLEQKKRWKEMLQKEKELKKEEIKQKLYTSHSYISPTIESKDFYIQSDIAHQQKIKSTIKEFHKKLAKQECYNTAGELVKKVYNNKKKILFDKIEQGKNIDLREIFQGQRLSDPLQNQRFQKKIDLISGRIDKLVSPDIIAEEDDLTDSKGNLFDQSHSAGRIPPVSKKILRKQIINKRVEQLIKKFEDKTSTFEAVTREKRFRYEQKLKSIAPPIGHYKPKYEVVDPAPKTPLLAQRQYFSGTQTSMGFNKSNKYFGGADQSLNQSQGFDNSQINIEQRNIQTSHGSHLGNIFTQRRGQRVVDYRNLLKTPNEGSRNDRESLSKSPRDSVTPQSKSRCIPNFERQSSRKLIIGKIQNLNENRFNFQPPQSSQDKRFKKLAQDITFGRQASREIQKKKKIQQGLMFAGAAPGQYTPSYSQIEYRQDRGIHRWDRKHLPKAFDLTREVKAREQTSSHILMTQEDDAMIKSVFNKVLARRLSKD